MIKSTASLIAFFFFVSTLYYVSYWGAFGIDAFQFLDVQDITKGILFPVKYSLFSSAIYLILILWTLLTIQFINRPNVRKLAPDNYYKVIMKLARLINLTIPFFILLYYIKSNVTSQATTSFISLILANSMINSLIMLFPALVRFASIKTKRMYFIYRTMLYLAFFISIYSYLSGITESKAVLSYTRFKYTLSKEISDNQNTGLFIFIGKIGNKYVFIDFKNQSRIFVDQSTLPKLILKIYNKDEPATAILLRNSMKELITLSPPQSPSPPSCPK